MEIANFPFETIDWSTVPAEEHRGETGVAKWQIRQLNQIRIRLVHYSAGYLADHWCKKGHIIHCLEGSMKTELEDGRVFLLTKGISYFVGDNNEAHRSSSKEGCQLLIVD